MSKVLLRENKIPVLFFNKPVFDMMILEGKACLGTQHYLVPKKGTYSKSAHLLKHHKWLVYYVLSLLGLQSLSYWKVG